MKNKKIKKYYVLIILLIVCLFLFLFSFLLKKDREFTIVESTIKDAVLSVNKVINVPIDYVNDKILEHREKKNIYNKYKKLQKKYKKVKLMESNYDEIKKELKELQDTLELNNSLNDSEYLNASVITRNIGYFYNELTIDKGKKDNVSKNMAVITNDGLVGIVTKVSNLNSVVKLITTNDTNNKISVKIKTGEDKYIFGLISGYEKKTKSFIVEGIANNEDIPIGSIVTTTGLGNDFPSGIMIGKVEDITKDNFDLARTLKVKSSVDFDDIEYVTLLKVEIK